MRYVEDIFSREHRQRLAQPIAAEKHFETASSYTKNTQWKQQPVNYIYTSPMPKKIVQIIDLKSGGGAETVMLQQAAAFNAAGWSVTVVMPKGPLFEKYAQQAVPGMEFVSFDFKENGVIQSVTFLRNLFKSREINVVHSHNFVPAIVCVLATLRKNNIKKLVTIHTDWRKIKIVNLFYGLRMYASMFFAYHFSFKTIAVSDEIKKITQRCFLVPSSKISVVTNGVDTKRMVVDPDRITDLKDQFNKKRDAFVLVNVGLLFALKGQHFLVEAMGKYLNDLNIICLLIGPQEHVAYVESLKQQMKAWSLEKRILFTGYQTDVQNWLSIADVYVHPSVNEAMPLVVLEAMYMGVTPVVFDLPAYRNVINNNMNGIIVPEIDAKSLAQAIRYMYENRALVQKMGKAAQNHIKQNFLVEHAVNKIASFL